MEGSSSPPSGHHRLVELKTDSNDTNGSMSPSSNSIGGMTPPSTHNHSQQQQHSIMIDNGHGEYFSVDGIQYSVANDEANVYSSQEIGSVFSYDDLYAVMDSTNSDASVLTKLDDTSSWQACGLVPIASSSHRISGTTGSSSAEGDGVAVGDGGRGQVVVTSMDGRELVGGYPSSGAFFRRLMANGTIIDNPAAANLGGGGSGSTNSTQSSLDSSNSSSSELPAPPITNTNGGDGGIPNGGDVHQSDVMQSPAAGVAPTATNEEGGKLKVRKPRGRKPKHVKEAELAAAAAAALASTNAGSNGELSACSSPSAGAGKAVGKSVRRLLPKGKTGNGDDVNAINLMVQQSPGGNGNMVTQQVHGQPQAQLVQQDGRTSEHPSPFAGVSSAPSTPAEPPQQQQQQPHPPSNKLTARVGPPPPGLQQMSLEQLASQDRRVIFLTKREVNVGPAAPSSPFPPNRHCHQFPNPPQNVNVHPRPPPHPIYANSPVTSTNPGGRLDQLFSSRIAAPSNKTIVKPKIIQENRQIYNLLTAPTTRRSNGFDCPKLSQERWMQFPNPSILPDEECGENSGGLGGDHGSDGSSDGSTNGLPQDPNVGSYQPQQQVHPRNYAAPPQDYHHHPTPQRQQQHQNLPPTQSSRFIIGHGGVNIRRDGDILGGVGVNARVAYKVSRGSFGGEGGGGAYHSRQPLHRSSGGPGGDNLGYRTFSPAQWMQIQQKFEGLTQDCYEQKCRVSFLQKKNKDLLHRLRQAYEQSEAWKSYAEQTQHFSGGPAGDYPLPPSYAFGGGLGAGGYFMRPGRSATPPYMEDRYLRREMMMGNGGGGLSGRVGGERGGIDETYYDKEVEGFGLGVPGRSRRNGGGGGGRNEDFPPWPVRSRNRPRSVVGGYNNGLFSSEEDLTFRSRSLANIERDAAAAREALHRARGGVGGGGGSSSVKRVVADTDLPLDPRREQHKKQCGTSRVGGGATAREEDTPKPPNNSSASDQGSLVDMQASMTPTATVEAVEKEGGAGSSRGPLVRNAKMEISRETGEAGITDSPSTLTDFVMTDDGDNTTSTLFSSPCSTGSRLSGSSAPPVTSISISSSSFQPQEFNFDQVKTIGFNDFGNKGYGSVGGVFSTPDKNNGGNASNNDIAGAGGIGEAEADINAADNPGTVVKTGLLVAVSSTVDASSANDNSTNISS